MPTYQYEAIGANGKTIKKTVEASTVDAARNSLRSAGYTILSLKEVGVLNRDIDVPFLGKPKPKDLALFCRQYVSVLRAGVPASQAMSLVGQQTENKKLAAAIREMQTDVEKGYSLADSVRKHTDIFGGMMPNMVAAGEESGNLEDSFTQMGAYYEKTHRTRSAVGRVLIYPIILVIVMIAVLILMMVKIVPTFMQTFDELDVELPGITRAVMSFSEFFQHWWWLVLLILGVIVAALVLYSKTNSGRHVFGWIARKIPVLGSLTVRSASALLTRTMSQLLGAGVPLAESMALSGGNMRNVYFQEAVTLAQQMVMEGRSLSASLRSVELFPPMVYNLVGVGEESGDLEGMLGKIADYYDEEVEAATQKLMALLEPIIILIMAAFVLVIVLAVFLPTLSMTQAYDQYL